MKRSLINAFSEWNRKRRLDKLCGTPVKDQPPILIRMNAMISYAQGDFETARLLLEESVDRGDHRSIYDLAHMYLTDRCGMKNQYKACFYLQLIAYQDSEASYKISEVMEELGDYDIAYFYGLVSCSLDKESKAQEILQRLTTQLDQAQQELLKIAVSDFFESLL